MKMNFKNFFAETDWADDLRLADEEWAYYLSFNEQLGTSTDYDDVTENLPEYAQMVGKLVVESKKKRREEPLEDEEDDDDDNLDADVDTGPSKSKKDDEANKLVNFTRQQWDQHQDDIKDLFRPRRDKKRKLRNPHAGLSLVSSGDNNPKTQKGYPHAVANPHHKMMRPMKNAVMHLLPAGFSGCNTCAAHTPECAASCLDVAGNPGFMGVKTSGRMRRTFMFAYNKNAALKKLAHEVERAAAESHANGFNFGIRLNGTSDIPWESEKYWFVYQRKTPKTKGRELPGYEGHIERHPKAQAMNCPAEPDAKKSIFCHFPEVQFYDYTKVIGRAMKHAEAVKSGGKSGNWPANYHLTFSYSEKTNLHQMEELLDNGGNVAMVFAFAEKNYDPAKAKASLEARARKRANKTSSEYIAPEFKEDPKGKEYAIDPQDGTQNGPYKLPKVWRGENGKLYRIVSGDIHDLRFIDDMQKGKDKAGVIIGLAAKGDAKYVQSNGQGKQVFVVQPDDPHLRYEEQNKGWVIAASKAHPQRLKTVEARHAKDAKLVAELRAKAAKAKGEEKEELLARADRIEQGIVNYFGPNAQRRRSNSMYDLAKTPDNKSEENPEGLSPMEFTRKVFQDKARRDLSNRINREIRNAERAGITREELMKGVKPTEKRRPIQWGDDDKNAYRAAVAKKYQDEDFTGLTPFSRDDHSPHYLATDKGRAPNDQPSGRFPLPMTTAPSALDRHIAPRRKEFEDEYAAAINGSVRSGPAAKPVEITVPKKKRRVIASESTNPYLSAILNLCCD